MKPLFFTLAFSLLAATVEAQLPFKFDKQYKTIYATELCKMLKQDPDLVLIDVRSPGEFSDTSQYASLNQGRLKGAINLDIEAIKKDPAVMDRYKDKTIVLYCSHSQRSRRVSKMLAENGFTSFYNLNGGMSILNQFKEKEFPCKNDLITSNLPYKNLSANDAAALIKSQKDLLVLDIRPAAQFNSTDSTAANNAGRIKGAVNVPYSELKQRMADLIKFKQQPVLVYSASGDGDAGRAAASLIDSGFKGVYQLLGGIQNLIASQEDLSFIENAPKYSIVNALRALQILKEKRGLVTYDTRPDEEYYNRLTGPASYRNLGKMKNAIHIKPPSFASQTFPADKTTPILVYGNETSYELSALLTERGYKNVYLLNSLYDFVWSGFNVESAKEAKYYMVNHDGLY